MSELNPSLKAISEAWSASMPILQGNPAIIEGIAPGCVVEQVDETVRTLILWSSRIKAPQGFRPIYPIVRLQLAASLQNLAQQAQNLKSDPVTYFPAFFAQLIQCFSPITAASTFSDKAESNKVIAELGGELGQHIALMYTAQQELDKKIDLLETSEETASAITERASQTQTAENEINAALARVSEQATTATSHLEKIESARTEMETYEGSLDALIKQNETLQIKLQDQSTHLQAISRKTEEQQKLIDALLPRGTSTGLASAFNLQRTRFGRSQAGWAGAFLASVVTLIVFAWKIKSGLPTTTPSEIWSYLLFRIPLASPMIWLGWFSAIQYGNVLRLKEDYAFKEATSMAFAGYRDHMKHLSDVSEPDAGSALNKLALVTISILGNDPLRLLQGQSADVSPLDKITALLKREQKPTEPKP